MVEQESKEETKVREEQKRQTTSEKHIARMCAPMTKDEKDDWLVELSQHKNNGEKEPPGFDDVSF